jgi:hypothetical protein
LTAAANWAAVCLYRILERPPPALINHDDTRAIKWTGPSISRQSILTRGTQVGALTIHPAQLHEMVPELRLREKCFSEI